MNEAAASLWSWTETGYSRRELIVNLCRQYGIDSVRAERDVNATLDAWRQDLLAPAIGTSTGSWHTDPFTASSFTSEDFSLNDCHIRILISSSELSGEISPRLESLPSAQTGQPDFTFRVWTERERILLAEGGEVIASEQNPNAVRAILLQEMVRRTEGGRDWLAILHAAACGDESSCVLLAGKSNSGKTTLSASLIARGLTFYCDDSAALGGVDGKISPMPFRIMVREGSWRVLTAFFPEIASSAVSQRYGEKVRFLTPPASRIAAFPGKPKSLVFISYLPGEKTVLQPLLPFQALLSLQDSGFWVEHDRDSIASFLSWLQTMPAFSLVYSDLGEAAFEIQKLALR